MTTPYVTGTVSVTAGSAIVTGVGTGWQTSGLVAGTFGLDSANGNPIPVLSIDSDTQITLAKPWRGTNASGQAYWITYDTQAGQQTVGLMQKIVEYIARLNSTALAAISGVSPVANTLLMFTGASTATTIALEDLVKGADYDIQVDTLAARATYDAYPANFRVLVSNIGDGRAAIYSKRSVTTADWSAPAYITGASGQTGATPTIATTATRLAAGALPTATVSPTSDGVSIAFGIPDGRTSGFPYRWSTTTADANPGNGLIRANNAALGSATLLFVSKTSLAGSAMATFLLGMAASDNAIKGTLILQRVTDGQTVSFNVTGVTDATNYVKVAVSGQSGLTAIANNTDLNFLFTQAGNKGSDGAGSGDVVGPNVAVNNRLPMFDGTTGKLLKDSGYGIGTSGNAVPLLSGSLTWSGAQTWNAAATATMGLTVGLDATADGVLLVTNNLSTPPPIAIFRSFRPSILLEDRSTSAQNTMLETDGNLFRLYSSAANDGTGLTERLRVNLTNGTINAYGELVLPASVAGSAMLNVPHGVAPTTLANGDIWTQTTGVFARVNGVTLNLSPALISQALAEGGVDTAIWSWSSQRIRQAIIASPAALLDTEDQTLTGGARVTSKSLGTISTGTLTLDPGDRPLQHYTNNGAHTLAPGANTGSFLLDITNGASAGAITVTGWTKVSGDAFTTTNGNKFRLHCSVGNGGSLLIVQALQ